MRTTAVCITLIAIFGIALCSDNEVEVHPVVRQPRQGEQGSWEEDNLNKNIVIEAEELADKQYKQAIAGQVFDNINGAVGALFGGSVLQGVLGRLFSGMGGLVNNKNNNAATKAKTKSSLSEDKIKEAVKSDQLLVGILALASKNPKQMLPLVVDVAKVPVGSTSDLFLKWAKNPKYISYSTAKKPVLKGQRKVQSVEDGIILLPKFDTTA